MRAARRRLAQYGDLGRLKPRDFGVRPKDEDEEDTNEDAGDSSTFSS